MELGTTFSHQQALLLGQDPQKSLQRILAIPIKHLRLCVYWSDIQPKPDHWNFDQLHWQLQQAQKAKVSVTIACGQKTPRWPEFHLPPWLNTDIVRPAASLPLFTYLEKLVKTIQKYSCITAWQLENEPFDPSGPNQQVISRALYMKELALLRSLDDRPILSTVWGNVLMVRNAFDQLLPLVDGVGIDLYPITPTSLPRPLPQHQHLYLPKWLLQWRLRPDQRQIYIAELQAEPWEKNLESFLSQQPMSMSPQQLKKNLIFAQSLGINRIDLWGAEYWLYAKDHLNQDYLTVVKQSV